MKQSIFICLLLLLFEITYSQEHRIIGLIDGQTIDNNRLIVMGFDYETGITDTICIIDQNMWVEDFSTAIDIQRERLFFIVRQGACGYTPMLLYSLNINTHELVLLDDIGQYALDGVYAMFYDMFKDRLIFRTEHQIFSFDLDSKTIQLLSTFESTHSEIWGQQTAYNPLTNKILIWKFVSDYYSSYYKSFYIDLKNGEVIKSIAFPDNAHFSFPTCDIIHDKYLYCNAFTDSIFEYNPMEGISTYVSTMCFENYAHLNSQTQVFDYVNNAYLIPIYKNNKNFLDINDLNSSISYCIDFQSFVQTNEHHLFSGKDVLLKYDDSLLIASLCPDYNWYYNDVLIESKGLQTFRPQNTGTYKFSSTIDGVEYFSNNQVVLFTNNQLIEKDCDIRISPNPSNGDFTIDFEKVINGNILLTITGIYGQVLDQRKINGNSCSISLNFPSGLYIFKFVDENGNTTIKKLLIER